MRAFILAVLLVSAMAVMASGYQFGAYDVFKPRPARLQALRAPQEWIGAPTAVENDPNYYSKLINYLNEVGRRR